MGGSAPQVPGPSAAETALQQQQTQTLQLQQSIIEKQMKTQDLLAPILYKQAGIQPTYDEQGNITGFSEVQDPLRQQQQTLQSEFMNRTQAALEGRLPVDPGLTQSLDQQEQQLRERLMQQLGPGYETSTPGIEALSKFNLNKQNILEGSRRGDLTMAEQLGLAQGAANLGQQGQNFGQIMGVGQSPFTGASALGSVAQGYGQAASQLGSERLAQYQAQLGGYQNQQRNFGSLFGGIGQLGGMSLFAPTTGSSLFAGLFGAGSTAAAGSGIATGLGSVLGGAAMFSDERVKKDIRHVGETGEGIPIYTYKYKGTDGPTHMGVMAQELAQVKPEAVAKFGDIFVVDYSQVH